MANPHTDAPTLNRRSSICTLTGRSGGRETTPQKHFNNGDEVIFVSGNMTGLTGKIVETDSRPGETAVFVAAWNSISYGIPEEHLFRLNP